VITKLSIVHFKAIASAEIPLGPITVLVGPNDSGKSTILQLARSPTQHHDNGFDYRIEHWSRFGT